MKNKPPKRRTDHTGSLKYVMHKILCGYEPERSTKILHASELLKYDAEFCPREFALLDLTGKTRPDRFVSTADRATWDFGNLYAAWLIDKLSKDKHVVGDWECKHCGKKYRFRSRPKQCKKCEHTHFNYVEVRFKSKSCGASCGVDLLWRMDDGKLKVVEVKSLKKEEFNTIAAPLAEHRWRTNLYMRIIEDSDHPCKDDIDTTEALVFYICKGGYKKDDTVKLYGLKDHAFSPFVEFAVARNDADNEQKWKHAVLLKKFRDDNGPIPLGLCKIPGVQRARNCPVRDECFSKRFAGK